MSLYCNKNLHLVPVLWCVLLFLLVRVSENTLLGTTYYYDSLNPLTNVNYGNGAVISYSRDAAGKLFIGLFK